MFLSLKRVTLYAHLDKFKISSFYQEVRGIKGVRRSWEGVRAKCIVGIVLGNWLDQSDQSDWSDWSDKSDKSDKSDGSDKSDWSDKTTAIKHLALTPSEERAIFRFAQGNFSVNSL